MKHRVVWVRDEPSYANREARRDTRRLVILLAIMVAVLCLPGNALAFRNTVNKRFATKTKGPMGAILVKDQNARKMAAAGSSDIRAQHNPGKLQRAANTYKKIQKLKLTRHRGTVRFPRTVAHTINERLVLPTLAQAMQTRQVIGAPANNLTFTFEGWSTADKAALSSYLQTAYAKAKVIYGPPAFNLNIKIILDTTLAEIQGGTYDIATNEIRLPALSGNFPEDTYILLMLVLNAFHDDVSFFYDQWEQGFIGAAAYVIQTQAGVSPGYDPIDPGPFYCLSVYEAENQEELGNSTFYPASGGTNMLVWRIAMARAAWLKCWIEKPTFFADFNNAYHAQYQNDLQGDIPTLKEIAQSVVPTVEGIPFVEWYEQQYVLDTSVRVGAKAYTWNIPLPESVALITELYETLVSGDEVPFGGQARTHYWDDTYLIELYAEEGNLIDIPAGGATPGEGFLLPTFYNIGGPQRITVQMDVGDLRRNYLYPYGMRGFELGENNFYGAITGADAGTIDAVGGTELTDVEVSRGVFGDRLTTAQLQPMQVAVTFNSQSGQPLTRRVNVGWDSYVFYLNAGQQVNAAHAFPYGRNGLYLMSIPVEPVTTNAAEALGVAAEKLLLAWWDPFFVGENKYRLWPSFRFHSPGRAYWWRVPANTSVNLQGVRTDPDKPYEVPLGPSWNLVGDPRMTSVPLVDVQVRLGENAPVTWAEAVTQRYMQDTLYGYNQITGYELKESFEPWEGYWMRCLAPRGVTLIFPAAGGSE